MCPYLVPYKGNVIVRDTCSLEQGRCRAFCPRLAVDMEHLHTSMFGSPYEHVDIGLVKDIVIAAAADETICAAGQYGGVVTALGCMALDDGTVDAVVATDGADRFSPFGRIARSRAELMACAGSSYTACAVVEAFNRGIAEKSAERMAVVCTPCQALALAHMRLSDADMARRSGMERLALVIGLFCTWALSYDGFCTYLKDKVAVNDVVRVDIPPPPADTFDLYSGSSATVSLPLAEVRPFIRNACRYCIDMTAEFADIAVGAAEGIEGWNTVIVRSEKGRRLIEKAVERGVITTKAMPEQNMRHLKEASLGKKKRGLENIVRKTGRTDDLLYLKKCPAALTALLQTEGSEASNGH
jgi:coenzyme F420 hydrogenase subunit beta